MFEQSITRDQMKRLQTLWGQYARHELIPNTRDARLQWANEMLLNRPHNGPRPARISSFNDLSLAAASRLINSLQGILGIEETSPAAGQRRYRSRIKDRDRAHAAGTEGRRGHGRTLTLASAEDLEMIDHQLDSMNWDRARLDALLKSTSSPLGLKSNPQIRTLADVNRVMYALKGIAKRQEHTA
jgi:hypothetical protein